MRWLLQSVVPRSSVRRSLGILCPLFAREERACVCAEERGHVASPYTFALRQGGEGREREREKKLQEKNNSRCNLPAPVLTREGKEGHQSSEGLKQWATKRKRITEEKDKKGEKKKKKKKRKRVETLGAIPPFFHISRSFSRAWILCRSVLRLWRVRIASVDYSLPPANSQC